MTDSKKTTIDLKKHSGTILSVIAVIIAAGSILVPRWQVENKAQEEINISIMQQVPDGPLNAYLVDVDYIKTDTSKREGLPEMLYTRDKDREDEYIVAQKRPSEEWVEKYFPLDGWKVDKVSNIRFMKNIRKATEGNPTE